MQQDKYRKMYQRIGEQPAAKPEPATLARRLDKSLGIPELKEPVFDEETRSVQLEWTYRSPANRMIEVVRSVDGGEFKPAALKHGRDGDAEVGKTYAYRVRVTTAATYGPWSNARSCQPGFDPDLEPGTLRLAATNDPGVEVTWIPPERGETFDLFRREPQEQVGPPIVKRVEGRTYLDKKVVPGRSYEYAVRSWSVGKYGPTSKGTSVVVPLPVVALDPERQSVSSRRVDLSWDPAPGGIQYSVTRDGSEIGTSRDGTFKDDKVSPGRRYRYGVRPMQGGVEAAIEVRTGSPSLVASETAQREVTLHAQLDDAPDPGAWSFQFQRVGEKGERSELDVVAGEDGDGGTATARSVTTHEESARYCVRAYRPGVVTAYGEPVEPQNEFGLVEIAAAKRSKGRIALEWDQVAGAGSYALEREEHGRFRTIASGTMVGAVDGPVDDAVACVYRLVARQGHRSRVSEAYTVPPKATLADEGRGCGGGGAPRTAERDLWERTRVYCRAMIEAAGTAGEAAASFKQLQKSPAEKLDRADRIPGFSKAPPALVEALKNAAGRFQEAAAALEHDELTAFRPALEQVLVECFPPAAR